MKTLYHTVVRDCIQTFKGNGCDNEVGVAKHIVNGLIDFANTIPLVDISVDAKVCYCDTDLCVPGGCGDDQLEIFNYW